MQALVHGTVSSLTMLTPSLRLSRVTIPPTLNKITRRGISSKVPTHLVFGANTDVGKTVITAGLVQSSAVASSSTSSAVHYIKPLQCGGSDQSFVESHLINVAKTPAASKVTTHTLFSWETPASPHVASRIEGLPVSDRQVLKALESCLDEINNTTKGTSDGSNTDSIWIETAGGVLSPSAASPDNKDSHHACGIVASDDESLSWGWATQADLYRPLQSNIPVVLVGDGRLGGISATLSSLESLILRGYEISGLIILETEDFKDNAPAIREYANRCVSFDLDLRAVVYNRP